ncbi:MAG: energy transducer TonB [Betaproteobacteria bacterium]|nr:energy transducer TonB [Betaproteobacteria bacterium]
MTFHSFDLGGIGTRRLRFAILASLVFHLLLLWPAPSRPPDKEAPLLRATLRPPPAPAVPAPSPPPRAAVMPAPTIAPRPPVLATSKFDLPTPPPVPQVPPMAADPISSPPPGPVLPAAAVATVAAAAPVAASPSGVLLTQANASGEALAGLRGYRLSVASQARRFKRYPPQATAAGWTGTAEVRLEVGSDGRPRAATVGRSSGPESLDRAALTMIDAGALRASLPESLSGRHFAVVLPVVFSLDEE